MSQHSGQHSGPRGAMLVVLSQHTHPAVLASWLLFSAELYASPTAMDVMPTRRVQHDGGVLSAHMGRARSTRPMRGCSSTPFPLFAYLRQSHAWFVCCMVCCGVFVCKRDLRMVAKSRATASGTPRLIAARWLLKVSAPRRGLKTRFARYDG